MAVASMLFTIFVVAKNAQGYSFKITILIMLIISAIVRVIERFQFTEYFVDSSQD